MMVQDFEPTFHAVKQPLSPTDDGDVEEGLLCVCVCWVVKLAVEIIPNVLCSSPVLTILMTCATSTFLPGTMDMMHITF